MAERLAIVTGTSRGIGAATARMLLERGWTVFGVARGEATVKHEAYRHARHDLSDTRELAKLRVELEPLVASAEWRRVGLVNNAALIGHLGRTSEFDIDDWARTETANVVAPMMLLALVGAKVPAGVPLRVVNISSGVATQAFPGMAAYSSTKAALRLGGMIVAKEWEGRSAHRDDAAVLSYEPGTVDTAMQTDARARSKADFPWVKMFTDFHEQGALVPAERPAAEIVEFLESTNAAYFSERRLKS